VIVPLAAGPARPLLHALPALIPVLVLILGLDVYCLVNLARSKSVRNAPKWAWVIVILCVSAPLGAILYLFFGMDRTGAHDRHALASSQPPPQAVPTVPTGPATVRATAAAERQQATGQEASGPIVTTTGLTRNYGGTGLFDVDLLVPRGSVYGLVGLNGAGKTTLLSILAGTRHADRGSVRLAIEPRRMAV
jgi:ABC-2 type transport system ATP-binding protein